MGPLDLSPPLVHERNDEAGLSPELINTVSEGKLRGRERVPFLILLS